MKKNLISILFLVLCLQLNHKVDAQSTVGVVLGNTSTPAVEFNGWNAGFPKHLDIVNTHVAGFPITYDINLSTSSVFGGTGWTNVRQRILGNYNGQNGLIAIGDLGTSNAPTFLPYSLLHSYRIGNQPCFHQFSIDLSNPIIAGGAPPTSFSQGLLIGVQYGSPFYWDQYGPVPDYSLAALKQFNAAPMDFYLNNVDQNPNIPLRMRLTYGVGGSHIPQSYLNPSDWATGVTKVTLSHQGVVPSGAPFYDFDHPVSMLNIGENHFILPSALGPYTGGARVWMDVGTFYCYDSDNMYTGLKDNGYNNKDAVINWGDDPTILPSVFPNHLFFNFTSTGGTSQADGMEGLEVARMFAPDGNYGMMGIGGDPNIIVPTTNFYQGGGVEPGNTLEVNSSDQDETSTSPGGRSGLRFSDLTSSVIPLPSNPGLGLLTVDPSGDVIYVPEIGNECGSDVSRPLRSDHEIPLDRYDYYFSGQGIGHSDVLIGALCQNPLPYAKLQSYQTTDQTGYFKSVAGVFANTTNDPLAIGGIGSSTSSKFFNWGLYGLASQDRGKQNIGVLGNVNPAALLLAGNINVGTYGYTNAPANPLWVNFAVVGDLGPATTIGIATLPDFAGWFNGDLLTTTAFYNLSDSTLKENIQDITNPMDVLNTLNPKAYTFKQQGNESMVLPIGTHYGVLAQNLETVLPGAVKDCVNPARYDSSGNQLYAKINFKAVNNFEIIPFLIAAVKEQQQTIDAMQAQLSNCCGGGNRNSNTGGEHGNSTSLDVELKNAKSIILNQNVPNPFAEQTSISYFLTDDVKKAQIFFYDNKGVILKIVDINEKGTGQLNVYAADLSSGSYTYSLIADGKLIETKKMVKTN